jgi:hypothetical protein
MEDTTSEVKQKFHQIKMFRTEKERFLMCAEMFESAQAIVLSLMPKDLIETEQKRFVYERTCGIPLPENF